jgi:DNA-binding NarL/FixJ family response regulator
MALIRILVVDDSPDWQRFLLAKFESHCDLKIIAVASDGLEGVQKATELQPDLMLMDLNLPVMNGFDATRRIREVSPNTKVLFLTQNASRDLVSAAFEAGACGYIVKSDSGADLVTGIKAVVENKQFVSRSLRAGSRK